MIKRGENMGRLDGKVAVVTGASRGIGYAVARMFLEEGAYVAAIYHNLLGELEQLLPLYEARLTLFSADVCDRKSVETVAAEIENQLGGVDILVNNAGVSNAGMFFAMSEEQWEHVIKTDLYGPRNVMQCFLLSMVRKRGGSIINMSSVSGFIGHVGQSNYCAAKAGLIGLTKSVAKEMAKKKIRINAIAPGYIDTEMVTSLEEKQQKEFKASIPMGRFGKAEEVAKAAVFLASEDASYITGQVIVVDGGMTA